MPVTRSVLLDKRRDRGGAVDGACPAKTTSEDAGRSALGEKTTSNTEQFAAQLYDELLGIAQRLLRDERAEHTLDTSAVVHEAFLRLAQQQAANWNDREHFLAATARTMRHVLVDYARERSATKRNAGVQTTMISIPDGKASGGDALDVMVLDDLLSRFAALYGRAAQVVELRVFGGFEVEEVAKIIKISPNTVKRDWQFAKAWLTCEMDLIK